MTGKQVFPEERGKDHSAELDLRDCQGQSAEDWLLPLPRSWGGGDALQG